MKSIERQLIINRLVYRLCPDMIPIIKSFCFETQVNANLVVVSRTVKRWMMHDLEQMDTWRTLNGAEWVVGFSVSVYGGKALSYPRYMEIGATNCGKCGGYVASLLTMKPWTTRRDTAQESSATVLSMPTATNWNPRWKRRTTTSESQQKQDIVLFLLGSLSSKLNTLVFEAYIFWAFFSKTILRFQKLDISWYTEMSNFWEGERVLGKGCRKK